MCCFDQGVDPCCRLKAGVRRPAGDGHSKGTASLAASLHASALRGSLGHENSTTRDGAFFEQSTRGARADLFICGDQNLDTRKFIVAKGCQTMNCLDQSAQHVKHPRAGGAPVFYRERAF